MKKTKHKIRELRRLVDLCGGKISLPGNHYGLWKASVETGDGTQWVKANADHIICHVRAVLLDRTVDVRYDVSPSNGMTKLWYWVDDWGDISGYFYTGPAAMIAALEETNE